MNYQRIGKVIKELRLAQNWKQAELAEGICTQGQLSKIEKGEFIPTSSTLYQLAQRLGFSIDDLFRRVSAEREDYVEQVLYVLRRFLQEEEYEQMLDLVAVEGQGPAFQSQRGRQVLLQYEGIARYHTGGSLQESLAILKRALELEPASRRLSMRAVEIWQDIGVLYLADDKPREAMRTLEMCQAALELFELCQSQQTRIRVLYNLSRTCSRLQRNLQAADYALQGLRICEQTQTLYLLGELYFQRGISLAATARDLREAQLMLYKSHLVFSLQENAAWAQAAQEMRQRLFAEGGIICK